MFYHFLKKYISFIIVYFVQNTTVILTTYTVDGVVWKRKDSSVLVLWLCSFYKETPLYCFVFFQLVLQTKLNWASGWKYKDTDQRITQTFKVGGSLFNNLQNSLVVLQDAIPYKEHIRCHITLSISGIHATLWCSYVKNNYLSRSQYRNSQYISARIGISIDPIYIPFPKVTSHVVQYVLIQNLSACWWCHGVLAPWHQQPYY